MLRRGRRIALLSVLAALGAAAPAHAGTYAVSACHVPGGAVAPLDGWSPGGFAGNTGATSARDECRGAGGMAIRFTPPSGSASGTWNLGDIAEWGFGAPDDTTLAALTLERTFSATGPSAVDWQVSGEGGYRETCTLAGGQCAGNARSIRFAGLRGSEIFLIMICDAPAGGTCDGPGAAAHVQRATVELRDDFAPLSTKPPAGPLVDTSHPLTGVATATVPLSDRGSGVRSLSAEVDGAIVAATDPVDANGGRCAPPYTARVPCKLAATGTVAVDTTKLADGPHQLRLIVRDASGNSSALGPLGITVRNTPVSCAAGTSGAITAGLPRRRSATQRRAKVARIRGTAPAGAELRLVARVSRTGAVAKPVGAAVHAGAGGRYSLRVPKGPSRTLRVGWHQAGQPDFACSRTLTLKVRARVSLRAPRSIPAAVPRATFRGRLRGGYVPRRGKLVLLQGKQPGRGWRTFRAVRTNRKGRFTTRYRFSGARGSFRVRARVPSEAAYPFAPASSRAVRVRVR
jgi:hypothetical protein